MEALTTESAAQGALVSQLGPTAWVVVCTLIIVACALYSIVLIYHWFSYSMNARVAQAATAVYLVIGVVFIISLIVHTVTLATL